MKIKHYRDNSENLVVAIEKAPMVAFRYLSWKLAKKFNLKKIEPETKTVDQWTRTYLSNKGKLSCDWDTWSGYTITALEPSSEELVNEIAEYLSQ